ncbi:Nose resistant to fluoxetine protein 6, partial [Operophtera brumata]
FDASAKSPQGLLFGSSYHLGNFDECVGIEDPGDNGMSITGQYCLATIKWKQRPEKKKVRTGRGETLRWAVCVPSACNAKAVSSFVNAVLSYTVGNSTGVEVTDSDCYRRKPLNVTTLDVSFFACNAKVVSSFVNAVLSYTVGTSTGVEVTDSDCHRRKPLNVTTLDVSYLSLILLFSAILLFSTIFELYTMYYCKNKESTVHDLIKSFSVINNMKKILSTKQHTSLGLECVTGIKALAMVFILGGHACLVTPAYLVVILFYMTWFPKIGEGPLWDDRLMLEQERCMASWWTNILYINNYVNTDQLCMFQSWYLSVDTQLFFIAPIFIYSLWRWRRVGPTLLSLALVVSLVIPAVITYKDKLDPTEFTDIASNFYFKEAYIKTHMKMLLPVILSCKNFRLDHQRHSWHSGHLLSVTILPGMTATAISHILLTFFLAIILCLSFESPLHGIEKILLRKFARPPISDNVRRAAESVESSRNTSQSKLDS